MEGGARAASSAPRDVPGDPWLDVLRGSRGSALPAWLGAGAGSVLSCSLWKDGNAVGPGRVRLRAPAFPGSCSWAGPEPPG